VLAARTKVDKVLNLEVRRMSKKRFVTLAVVTTAVVAVLALLLLEKPGTLPPAPISVSLIQSATFGTNGNNLSGPTFRLTNFTSKILSVTPWTVQVREGTNWTKRDYHSPGVMLAPHAEMYLTIDFASQNYGRPTNTWRVEINVAEKLNRPASLFMAIKHYPAWLQHRRRSGQTNLPTPGLFKMLAATWYGYPRKVLGEEIASP
jgi:hypothetical protein